MKFIEELVLKMLLRSHALVFHSRKCPVSQDLETRITLFGRVIWEKRWSCLDRVID